MTLTYDNFTVPLLQWYRRHARELPWRETQDPYKIWVSEIMLQQTRVETVIPYYEKWLEAFPTVIDLARAEEEDVLFLWEGLGYYRRARYLYEGAKGIDEVKQTPISYQGWRSIKGVGDYTAGAIASIAFGQRVPAIDGNVLRVMARVLAYEEDVLAAKAKRVMAKELTPLLPNERDMGDFTQALIELGALVCVPKGVIRCDDCPLSKACEAKRLSIQWRLPLRKNKTKVKEEDKTVLLMEHQGKWAITQRKEKLLEGLWEFPMIEGHKSAEEWESYLKEEAIDYSDLTRVKDSRAVFSHRKWHLEAYKLKVSSPLKEYTWVKPEELDHGYPMASAVRNYEKELMDEDES